MKISKWILTVFIVSPIAHTDTTQKVRDKHLYQVLSTVCICHFLGPICNANQSVCKHSSLISGYYPHPRWRHQMETLSASLALCAGRQPSSMKVLWCGKFTFTGHRWISRTKASDAELWWFLWFAPEQTVEQLIVRLIVRLVIWDAMALILTSL